MATKTTFYGPGSSEDQPFQIPEQKVESQPEATPQPVHIAMPMEVQPQQSHKQRVTAKDFEPPQDFVDMYTGNRERG